MKDRIYEILQDNFGGDFRGGIEAKDLVQCIVRELDIEISVIEEQLDEDLYDFAFNYMKDTTI